MRSRFSMSLEGLVSVGIWFFEQNRLSTNCFFPYCPFFNPLFKNLTLENSLHEHARRMNHFRVQFPGLNQVFDFGNRNFCSRRHHGIEISRGLAVDEIAPSVALPSLDKCEVSLQGALHDVGATIEFARLFAF